MNVHELSAEAFLDAWIGQSVFHRSRLCANAARQLAEVDNDGMHLSLMLDVVTQYVQALQDFVIWSCAVREAVEGDTRIDDVLNGIKEDWAGVITSLQLGTRDAYRDLWALPDGATFDRGQEAYLAQLDGWAAVGKSIASTLDARTPGGSPLMRRVLNKTKHGLYVSGAYSSDRLFLVFHPEGAGGGYSVQVVDEGQAVNYAVKTYRVSKTLAGTLGQVFASWYGRVPHRPWATPIEGGVSEDTLEGILEICTTVAIPRLADVEVGAE